MEEKLAEYKERHIRWQDISLTQFGYTNNIFLTLAIGFLAFAFDKDSVSAVSFSKESEFDLEIFLSILTILSMFFSIGYGVLISISRLYDFKITRHIVLTRQRYFDEFKNDPKALPGYDFPRPNFKLRSVTLYNVLFKRIIFIDKSKIKDLRKSRILRKNFNQLRRTSNTLGFLTWRLLKIQVLAFVVSILLYSINLLM